MYGRENKVSVANATLTLVLLANVIAGCASLTPTQIRAQQIDVALQNVSSKLISCDFEIRQTEVFKRLDPIVVSNLDDPQAVQKMTIERYVTDQERSDVLAILVIDLPCKKIGLEGYGEVHPGYVDAIANYYANVEDLVLDVVNRKVMIGEANQRLRKLRRELQQQFKTVTSELGRQLQRQIALEKEQQERQAQALEEAFAAVVLGAAISSLNTWNHQQTKNYEQHIIYDPIREPNRPEPRYERTNCSFHGNRVRCTTFY